MNKQLSIINTNIDITKPAQFAEFAHFAKTIQDQLDAAWDAVKQQMIAHGVTELEGDYGKVAFELANNLVIVNANVLDPSVTKPALDTDKVKAYRTLMGELPAGVSTVTVSKFVKRIKVAA